jgi:hypothetical protein
MIERRTIIGFALMCALLLCAVAAQGASAAGNGQTINECVKVPHGNFSDAHCDSEVSPESGEYLHVQFPTESTAITLTNGGTAESTKKATTGVLHIALLHGFKNVNVECTNVEGTGTAQNVAGPPMVGKGSGIIKFNNGTGVLCHTNQSGCEGGTATVGAKVSEVKASAETVEGGTLGSGMGLKFSPTTGSQFATITFEGSCGLHAFGAIPVAGSTIATAGGEPNGHGATAWFTEEMSSLTVGGEPAGLTGKATLKRTSNGNALTLTTS